MDRELQVVEQLIPHLIPSLRRYAEHHIETGGFLRAVLENDLYKAVARADSNNLYLLAEILMWIEANVPHESYGSREAVAQWLKKREAQRAKKDCNPEP